MHKHISNNLWKYWNIETINIISEAQTIIKNSLKINNELASFNINNINDVQNFINIMMNDINEIQKLHSVIGFYQYISSNEKIKTDCFSIDQEINKYYDTLNNNKQLYEKIKYIKNTYGNKINKEDLRLFDKLIINYERNGINLSNDRRQLIIKIKHEISKLETTISKSLMSHENDIIELTYNDLVNVPLSILNNICKITHTIEKYKITLSKQNYNILTKYVSNPDVRQQIENLYITRFDDIIEHFCKLLVLRDKYSKILGYDNYSDYKAYTQMTKHSDNIKNFLTEVLSKLDFRYKREMDTILKIHNKHNSNKNISTSDIAYLINKWKQEYGINDNMIREYFDLNNTINNIFSIYTKLFDIKFNKINNSNIWNSDVITYSILNPQNDNIIGYLYLDFYVRQGKYKQIRCFSLQQGTLTQLPINALIASFNKNNTLITFQDMISLYHEMGHVIHNIFGRTKYALFSGVNVENDFIETPAQLLDFMCWEKNVIQTISMHHNNKNILPDEIINKIVKIKNLDIGLYYKKHITIALFDQLLYSSDNFINSCENFLKSGNKNELKKLLSELYKNLHNEIMSYDSTTKYNININNDIYFPIEWINSIGICDAHYYSSIWSRVLSADMFNDKIKSKPINSKIGMELIKHILQYGGSKPAYEMICDYIERKPAVNGFISMFDLDTDAEYSFFLNTDQLKSAQFNNKQKELPVQQPSYKQNSPKHTEIDSVSNKFSEIYESSVNVDDFDNQTEDATYIKNKFKKYAY
ncbi:peptidase M3A/M3B [Fadolivirus algeromassiliense]|jgi:Zn-dependent oligopeptidase|uniref:Peptidase M3A/M3B n=1 Tax=Fadolivirus FV1/VV64 TaxID=3070911 RepID=A0A7D3QTX5_9VIRU|nr:peptidase M3A/M3B [Fadolivirus algeromassiliense]QKF93687.1 peptidase M3A/M3B [Fadolivirus FV1/VV64]